MEPAPFGLVSTLRASIPDAFAPLALRAALASWGKAEAIPRRAVAWHPPGAAALLAARPGLRPCLPPLAVIRDGGAWRRALRASASRVAGYLFSGVPRRHSQWRWSGWFVFQGFIGLSGREARCGKAWAVPRAQKAALDRKPRTGSA